MNFYINKGNKNLLHIGCNKMLKEKFNLNIDDTELFEIINDVMDSIKKEYNTRYDITLKELNNITLSKVKIFYDIKINKINTDNTDNIDNKDNLNNTLNDTLNDTFNDTLNDNLNDINFDNEENNNDIEIPIIHNKLMNNDLFEFKIKQLELNRNIIPVYSNDFKNNYSDNHIIQLKSKPQQDNNNISFSMPNIPNISNNNYKSFVINSLTRDWSLNTQRNNIKFNLNIDIKLNNFFPDLICFPSYVKELTPYIIAKFSDGRKNIYYTFTCYINNGNWDIWKTFDNIEKIDLESNNWLIIFYDFLNKELNLGYDNLKILEASNIESNNDNYNLFKIKIESDILNNFNNIYNINDMVNIKKNNGSYCYKKIIKIIDNDIIIYDNKELKLDDFLNSKILLCNKQYSIIIKYYLH